MEAGRFASKMADSHAWQVSVEFGRRPVDLPICISISLLEYLHNIVVVFLLNRSSKRTRQSLQYLLRLSFGRNVSSFPEYLIGYTGHLYSVWEVATHRVKDY